MRTDRDADIRRAQARGLRVHGRTAAPPSPELLPYRWRCDPRADTIERVNQWRRSLLAAVLVLELVTDD